MGKPTLELKIGKHKALPDACGHTTVFKGVGKSKPDFTNLGDRIAKRVAKNKKSSVKKGKKGSKTSAKGVTPATPSFLPPSFNLRRLSSTLIAAVPANDADFDRLVNGADVLQKFMIERQFEQFVDMILKDRESVMRDGLAFVPADTKKGVQTQIDALSELRKELTTQLPIALKKAVAANPGASVNDILNQLLSATMEELGGFLSVSDGYQTALLQWRDPVYRDKLMAINFLMREQFRLFMTGSLDSQKDGTTSAPFIPTQSFKVGMAILTAFAGMGLGTIPGWGPLGLHLLMIPKDMFDFAPCSGPLFFHESMHQVIADANLLKEMQNVVVKALNAAFQQGTLNLTTQTVQIGRFKKQTIEVLGKVYTDWINEIVADLFGGVLNGGPSFAKSMLQSFPALGIRGKKVSESDVKLRTSSGFSIVDGGNGKKSLEMEAHPIDYIRLYIVAAAFDLIGFKAVADLCRKQADLCVGTVPQMMTWSDFSGQSNTVISVATADLIAAAPVVVNALIWTKLSGANNNAFGEIVMWNEKREKKVDALGALLRQGISEPPTDIGDIHPQYVFAAGAAEVWNASDKSGDELSKYVVDLSKTVVDMVLKLEKKQAE